jgi:hypothetical protein
MSKHSPAWDDIKVGDRVELEPELGYPDRKRITELCVSRILDEIVYFNMDTEYCLKANWVPVKI